MIGRVVCVECDDDDDITAVYAHSADVVDIAVDVTTANVIDMAVDANTAVVVNIAAYANTADVGDTAVVDDTAASDFLYFSILPSLSLILLL